MTPQEFRQLDPKKQLWHLTRAFFAKVKSNPKKDYWRVNTFFKKQTLDNQHLIYDYLDTLEGMHDVTMTEVFENAQKYQESLRFKPRNDDVKPYEDLKSLLEGM